MRRLATLSTILLTLAIISAAYAEPALRHAGRQQVSSTATAYFGSRGYQATNGRFLSTDAGPMSAVSPQSFNRYAAFANNPLNLVDRDGNAPASAYLPITPEQERALTKMPAFERATAYRVAGNALFPYLLGGAAASTPPAAMVVDVLVAGGINPAGRSAIRPMIRSLLAQGVGPAGATAARIRYAASRAFLEKLYPRESQFISTSLGANALKNVSDQGHLGFSMVVAPGKGSMFGETLHVEHETMRAALQHEWSLPDKSFVGLVINWDDVYKKFILAPFSLINEVHAAPSNRVLEPSKELAEEALETALQSVDPSLHATFREAFKAFYDTRDGRLFQ